MARPPSSRSGRSLRAMTRLCSRSVSCSGSAGLPAAACAATILFVGNSFTAGAGLPQVEKFRPDTVTDLNREEVGGVPALFKAFARQAGLAGTTSTSRWPAA